MIVDKPIAEMNSVERCDMIITLKAQLNNIVNSHFPLDRKEIFSRFENIIFSPFQTSGKKEYSFDEKCKMLNKPVWTTDGIEGVHHQGNWIFLIVKRTELIPGTTLIPLRYPKIDLGDVIKKLKSRASRNSVRQNRVDSWTTDDNDVIKLYYLQEGAAVAKRLMKNRTKNAIIMQASRLGIKTKKGRPPIVK